MHTTAFNTFVDQLTQLPYAGWLHIGRTLAGDSEPPVRQAARGDVARAIADHRLAVAAWLARDAVDTVVYLATRPMARASRSDQRLVASAHRAAEAAALAIVAAPYVSATSLRTLCEPFQRVTRPTIAGNTTVACSRTHSVCART
jgi:hypothetical protein